MKRKALPKLTGFTALQNLRGGAAALGDPQLAMGGTRWIWRLHTRRQIAILGLN